MNPVSLTTADAVRSETPNGFSSLSSDEFTRIIMTELTNQDPLAPSDTSAILEQVSTIRSIQSDIDLAERLDSLVTQNQIASAGSLIGRYVLGRTESLRDAEGLVESVSVTPSGPVLNLDSGDRIPLSSVTEMLDLERLLNDEG